MMAYLTIDDAEIVGLVLGKIIVRALTYINEWWDEKDDNERLNGRMRVFNIDIV